MSIDDFKKLHSELKEDLKDYEINEQKRNEHAQEILSEMHGITSVVCYLHRGISAEIFQSTSLNEPSLAIICNEKTTLYKKRRSNNPLLRYILILTCLLSIHSYLPPHVFLHPLQE